MTTTYGLNLPYLTCQLHTNSWDVEQQLEVDPAKAGATETLTHYLISCFNSSLPYQSRRLNRRTLGSWSPKDVHPQSYCSLIHH